MASNFLGETGRQLKIRIYEHRKAWEKKKLSDSTLTNHLITTGHSLKESFGPLLHRESSYFKRTVLEHNEIICHLNNDNLNVLNRYIPDEGLIELVYEYDSHCDDSLVQSRFPRLFLFTAGVGFRRPD